MQYPFAKNFGPAETELPFLKGRLLLQSRVRPITKRLFSRMFTSAPGHSFRFFEFNFHWGMLRPCMGTIAKGLGFRPAASTPVIRSGFHFHHIWNTLGAHNWVSHSISPFLGYREYMNTKKGVSGFTFLVSRKNYSICGGT